MLLENMSMGLTTGLGVHRQAGGHSRAMSATRMACARPASTALVSMCSTCENYVMDVMDVIMAIVEDLAEHHRRGGCMHIIDDQHERGSGRVCNPTVPQLANNTFQCFHVAS